VEKIEKSGRVYLIYVRQSLNINGIDNRRARADLKKRPFPYRAGRIGTAFPKITIGRAIGTGAGATASRCVCVTASAPSNSTCKVGALGYRVMVVAHRRLAEV
jgi:hypothetical protein